MKKVFSSNKLLLLLGIITSIPSLAYSATANYVAVGNSINYSADGINWNHVAGSDGVNLRGIVYGNNEFVAVGKNGSVYHSANGTSWRPAVAIENTPTLQSIAYGKGKFVAVGPYGVAYYSTDGITWTHANGTKDSDLLFSVTYGRLEVNHEVKNGFVAVGNLGAAYYSTDGITWTHAQGSIERSGYIYSVAYGNGKFVAVGFEGAAYYSNDGVYWWDAGTPANLMSVAYGNDEFVAVGWNGAAYHSINGVTWQAATGLTYDLFFASVTHGRGNSNNDTGNFVAVGNFGATYYSRDGMTWQSAQNNDSSDLACVAARNK